MYYKESYGAILVFDLTRPETFQSVLKWKREIDSKVRGRAEEGRGQGGATGQSIVLPPLPVVSCTCDAVRLNLYAASRPSSSAPRR